MQRRWPEDEARLPQESLRAAGGPRGPTPESQPSHSGLTSIHRWIESAECWTEPVHSWMESIHRWTKLVHRWTGTIHFWIKFLHGWTNLIHRWMLAIHGWTEEIQRWADFIQPWIARIQRWMSAIHPWMISVHRSAAGRHRREANPRPRRRPVVSPMYGSRASLPRGRQRLRPGLGHRGARGGRGRAHHQARARHHGQRAE